MSLWHWVVVAIVALLLFGGGGKISNLMGDLAKGIKSFKKGMAEDDVDGTEPEVIENEPPRQIAAEPAPKRAPAKKAATKRATKAKG
jgi:sec-independent protein translocase protein TatA